MNLTMNKYRVIIIKLNENSLRLGMSTRKFTESSRGFFFFCCNGGRRDGLEREDRGSVERETGRLEKMLLYKSDGGFR